MVIQFNEDKQNQKLAELRKRDEENLTRAMARKYGLPYVDLSQKPLNIDALRVVSESKAKDAHVAPLELINKRVELGVLSPVNEKTKEIVAGLETQGYGVELSMVSKTSLERVWERYKELSYASETKSGSIDISNDQVTDLVKAVASMEDIGILIDQTLKEKKSYRISRVLEIIIAGAISLGASDIHIEPEEGYVQLRYRLDGTLTKILTFDHNTYKLLDSRIKLISNLTLNVKNEAQDGRFSIKLGTSEIEVRTSVLPGAYGESIVMRILNPDSISVSLEDLGINPYLLEIMNQEISKPNGLILTTGPTGSGKTTTLYSFLRKIHKPHIKIITIEDPIEYHMPGIVQTQVDTDGEYHFAEGLRSSLRQDPDVIMVGEIRDRETAEIAINASLTGHLVFSTLHTNNAAGTFPRLSDLGVNSRIISSALNLAIAQRLVRKLCSTCKKQVPLEGKYKDVVEKTLAGVTDKTHIGNIQTSFMWETVGCDACNSVGYKGRVGVFEAIRSDKALEDVLDTSPNERDVREATRGQNILSMQEDGILKILNGITSFEELERVIELE